MALSLSFRHFFDHPSRYSCHDGIGRNILGDHRSCCYHGIYAHRHSRKDYRIGANSAVPLQDDALEIEHFSLLWSYGMVFSNQTHLWAYQYLVLNYNASQVQKGASMVDKHVFTQLNVLPKVGMKRGEHRGALVHYLPDYFRKVLSNLGNISGGI